MNPVSEIGNNIQWFATAGVCVVIDLKTSYILFSVLHNLYMCMTQPEFHRWCHFLKQI